MSMLVSRTRATIVAVVKVVSAIVMIFVLSMYVFVAYIHSFLDDY